MLACSSKDNESDSSVINNVIKDKVNLQEVVEEKNEVASFDTIILVRINNISFNWNNYTKETEKDALYKKLKSKVVEDPLSLVNQIGNTTKTKALGCKNNKLVCGDLAFIVLDEIYRLPLFLIFKKQCDSYVSECPYPDGYFEVINSNRSGIMLRTKEYFRTKK